MAPPVFTLRSKPKFNTERDSDIA